MSHEKVNALVTHLFRLETGKMNAVLTRMLGFENLTRAEDIVQETLLSALSVWRIKGIPENPSAWLHTVAKRKAIDLLRKQKIRDTIHNEMALVARSELALVSTVNRLFTEGEIEDSQLRMIFACCHPAINYESQIALILKHLCGLSIGEIAHAFLTTEETITKRLYRAREKFRTENIKLIVPSGDELTSRLDVALHSLYLLFNEGYHSSHPDKLIRFDLAEEAMRLCMLLVTRQDIALPKVRALLSLMCLHASRMESRLDASGNIILMRDQRRDGWNKKLIEQGLMYLQLASTGDEVSEYHIEAAIASCHVLAPNFEATDWKQISVLYDALERFRPGPVVALNKAVAIGYANSPEAGIAALLEIKGVDDWHLYHAALGDFYEMSGDVSNAGKAFAQAIAYSRSDAERALFTTKRDKLLKKTDSVIST